MMRSARKDPAPLGSGDGVRRPGGAEGAARPSGRSVVGPTLWNYGGSAAAALLQLAYTVYTGRNVDVATFGAFASALAVIQLMTYFANAGLATTMLRSTQPIRGLLAAALRMGLVTGLVCCLVAQATASLWGEMFQTSQVVPMLRVLACQLLVMPAAAVTVATLRRLQAQRAAVASEVSGQIAGLLSGILLLSHGLNPIGLAIAPLVTQLCTAALASAIVLRRIPLASDGPRHPIKPRMLFAASGLLVAQQLAQLLTGTAPQWAAGMALGSSAAGFYSRASMFIGVPQTMLAAGLSSVATPMVAVLCTGGRQPHALTRSGLREAVTDVQLVASALGLLPFALLATLGPDLLHLLLGPGWTASEDLVPWVSASGATAMLYGSALAMDTAQHRNRAVATALVTALGVTAALLVPALAHRDLGLLGISVGAGYLCAHIVQLCLWRADGVVDLQRLLPGYACHVVLGGIVCLAGMAASHVGREQPGAHTITLALSASAGVVACWVCRRRLPLHEIARRRGLLRRPMSTGNPTHAAR